MNKRIIIKHSLREIDIYLSQFLFVNKIEYDFNSEENMTKYFLLCFSLLTIIKKFIKMHASMIDVGNKYLAVKLTSLAVRA